MKNSYLIIGILMVVGMCSNLGGCASWQTTAIMTSASPYAFFDASVGEGDLVNDAMLEEILEVVQLVHQTQRSTCDGWVTPPDMPNTKNCPIPEYWTVQ